MDKVEKDLEEIKDLVKDVKVLMDVEQNILVNINNYKVLYI